MAKQLGKTIRIIRQAKELKIFDIAKDAEISIPFLSLVERGERQPSLEVLERIADALKVPVEVFVSLGSNSSGLAPRRQRSGQLVSAVSKLIELETKLQAMLDDDETPRAKKRKAH